MVLRVKYIAQRMFVLGFRDTGHPAPMYIPVIFSAEGRKMTYLDTLVVLC
jgi:hypothetical protein